VTPLTVELLVEVVVVFGTVVLLIREKRAVPELG
jgi:hypothetical protein